ncbi:MAG TPA: DUF2293 domain-containing protein [Bryobacteraceae bacterium]|jgi:hypothetical protein|nr:DUF2293 domain-containing protein [Bryobacteraceae bacterium]
MGLLERVTAAAEAALADHQYASFIDVLTGMGLLHNVQAWHNGRVQYLDEMVQGGPEKLRQVIDTFQKWAAERGLRAEDLPPHASFVPRPPKYHTASQFPVLEQAFRQHFVSPRLPEKKLEKLREKVSAPAPPTVFSIVKESKCSQCNQKLWKGELLTMQASQPLCMECADLDHLVFLGSGDAALTRRATKHSSLWAVVVRFSRSRGRYERQGVLVQPDALEKAGEECLADADLRAARQVRDAERRRLEDGELAVRMADKIRALYPGCPPAEARRIAAHTAARGSGRVGRSAAGRALDDQALALAVGAWVRHRHTRYDELLMSGQERSDARGQVREEMDQVLDRWSML